MGRKSSLSEQQWVEVGKRLLDGETPEAVAADLTKRGSKVSPNTIRSHFERKGQSTKTVQQMAGQIYEADLGVRAAEQAQRAAQLALQRMPAASQVAVMTLAARMRNVADQLGTMMETSAGTAIRFATLANTEAQQIDDVDPFGKTKKRFLAATALQKAANEAAEMPKAMYVATANRDAIKRLVDDPPPIVEGEALTPERMKDGVRRIAFMLRRAATETN
jgi:hypothetical protein